MKTIIGVILATIIFGDRILYLYLKRTRFNKSNDIQEN